MNHIPFILSLVLCRLEKKRSVYAVCLNVCAKESKLMFSKVNNTKKHMAHENFSQRKRNEEPENDRNVYCARHAFIQIIYHLFILSALFCFVSYVILIFHLVSSLCLSKREQQKRHTRTKMCLDSKSHKGPFRIWYHFCFLVTVHTSRCSLLIVPENGNTNVLFFGVFSVTTTIR